MPAKVILVTGYFGADTRESKLDYFARLDGQLRKRDVGLYLFNLNGNRIPAPLRGECVPLFVEKSHWLPLDWIVRTATATPEILDGASIDAACWKRSPERERIRVLLFREHVRTILRREKPVLCLAWHQFFGLHYGIDTVLRDFGIPWRYAEFGPLPGTILFDEAGQGAESPIVTRSEEFTRQPVSEFDIQRASAFLERVRAEKRTRKPQAGAGLVTAAVRGAADRGQKVVFYAGQYDCRTGMVPRTLPRSATHSPFFLDTVDALSFLSGLARRNNWLILFKPHPLAQHSDTALREIEAPDHVVTMPDANLFECLEQAAATATIVSQVSYMSLIYGRPCVMLGRSYLAGKGCVGEPHDREQIEGLIAASLTDGVTAEQQTLWVQHVAQLLKYSLFAFDEGFSADGLRGLDETAGYLESVCAVAGTAPVDDFLLRDVCGDVRVAAALRRLYKVGRHA